MVKYGNVIVTAVEYTNAAQSYWSRTGSVRIQEIKQVHHSDTFSLEME